MAAEDRRHAEQPPLPSAREHTLEDDLLVGRAARAAGVPEIHGGGFFVVSEPAEGDTGHRRVVHIPGLPAT